MYSHEIYLRKRQLQLKGLMQSDRGCLAISPHNNPLFYPAQILLGFGRSLAADLISKQDKTQQEFVYLIVALKLTSQSYHPQLSEMKLAYPDSSLCDSIDRLVEYFSTADSFPQPTTSKEHLQRKFELLIGKAEAEGYFSIPGVPAFLVSTRWLERFFSSDQGHPGPVTNQTLLDLVPFPLAEPSLAHLNYLVRPDVRENEDFKVLPYEAWKLLDDNYGGVEVRRFTSNEKKPSVEIWYAKTSIWVVEERAVIANVPLLIAKSQGIQDLLARLKLTLKKYCILPDNYIARQPTIFKVNGLDLDQFSALLHNEAQSHLLAQRMERVKDPKIEFDELAIYSNRQSLVINFGRSSSSVFDRVPLLKVIELRERCLHCGGTEGLQLCKCKTVYFCSKLCRDNKKEHLKECSSLQGEARKFATVTELFEVTKKTYPHLQGLVPLGKVGLENLGNTCYLNSAMQCVLRLEPLSRYFLRNEHVKDLNVGNVLGSEGYLACAFGQLVKSFYNTNRRALEPSAVLRVIAKNPQFRGYNHQDSQEFLNYFLDKLHEDLNRVREKPYTEEIQSNGRPDQVVSQLSWDNYLKRNKSVIVDLLAGQYRSEIRCPDCHRLSITFDPFLSLTLQFPRPEKGVTLKGWILTEDGQFQNIDVEVRATMASHQFYEKYFKGRVHGVYQRQKKITDVWDANKSVFQNFKEKGVLFFYDKPIGHGVQVQFQFYSPGKQVPENFVRIVFVKDILGAQELLRLAFLSIRKPLEKSLGKDHNTQQFLDLCHQLNFITLEGVERTPAVDRVYPITGTAQLRVRLQLDQSKLKLASPLRLNSGTGKYEANSDSLIRKVGKELSIAELLQCFSQPERLTQDNAWYCSNCKDHKLAEKAMQLYRVPKILIVHLKRFNHRGDSGNRYIIYGEKVSTPIGLAEFELFLGKRYELIGVVNHVGSLVYGHYTAMVKRGEWFNYDDSRCGRTTLDGRHAYLLFYQLVE